MADDMTFDGTADAARAHLLALGHAGARVQDGWAAAQGAPVWATGPQDAHPVGATHCNHRRIICDPVTGRTGIESYCWTRMSDGSYEEFWGNTCTN